MSTSASEKRHADGDLLSFAKSRWPRHSGHWTVLVIVVRVSGKLRWIYISGYVCVRACVRACACQRNGSWYLGGRRNYNGNSIPTYCRHMLNLLHSYRSLFCASDETHHCLGTSHFFTLLWASLIVAIYLNGLVKHLVIRHWTSGIDFFLWTIAHPFSFWYNDFVIGVMGGAVVHPHFRQTLLK